MICPCCGFKFAGDLQREACRACGARAVGPPLARPAEQLPSYIHALIAVIGGALALITFAVSTLAALIEHNSSLSISFWNLVAAGETAAWRLKWLALPFATLSLWSSSRAWRKIRREPKRFVGLTAAQAGFAMSALVAASITLLIGMTIPERLRQRELALRAADNALVYATHGVLLQYKMRYKTLPPTPDELRRLPDPDGSVDRVISILKSGAYSPETNLASIPSTIVKGRGRRISTVRTRFASAQTNTDDGPTGKVSLTNYEMMLPGRDKILGTPDDIKVQDGLTVEVPSALKQSPRGSFDQ